MSDQTETRTRRFLRGLLKTTTFLAVIAGVVGVMYVRGFQVDVGTSALGLMTGTVYGLLAIGLVLVHRSSRFINFAHGDIGFLGAVALLTLTDAGWPYWLAFVLGVCVSAAVGAATEVVVVRRLKGAPRLMSMAATLLLSRFLLGIGLAINSKSFSGYLYPQPAGFSEWRVGVVTAKPSQIAMLVLTPILVTALVVFLRRGRAGLAIHAAAENPEAAAMAGILPARAATMSWAIAGGLASVTAMLWLPTKLLALGQFGPSLLVRGLAAAVVARMTSLPIAFAAGIGLGVLESVITTNSTGGEVELWMFGVILLALLTQKKRNSRDEDGGSWTSVLAWPPLPASIARLPIVRLTPYALTGLAAGGAYSLIPLLTSSASASLQASMGFMIVGLSIGLVTGMAGQLSLGQFAIAAAGAVAMVRVADLTDNTFLGLAAAGAVGGLVSILVGLPALRLRGLLLAVATLSFALAAQSWFLPQTWAVGGGYSVPDPVVFGNVLETKLQSYPFAIAITVVMLLFTRNIRRSAFGRTLVALRDNEDAARAFTIHATRRKIEAYGIAGIIAGVGGGVYSMSLQGLTSGAFPVTFSIDIVAATVIGGIAVLAGPIIGTLFLVTIPLFFSLDQASMALHLFLALMVILLMPNGLTSMLRGVRERAIRAFARVHRIDLDVEESEASPSAVRLTPRAEAPTGISDEIVLSARDLAKSYGGVVAVAGVSFDLRRGETLGLIGPNGAGKTTLFELLAGFTRPDQGKVIFADRDVTRWGPERRAELGLVRSFQEASLFPTMTLAETVRVAHERVLPSSMLRAMIGIDRNERRRIERSRELLALMGLDHFRDRQIAELSTGTRRMAELACLLALEPRILLLDEPAAGVAQSETEQLGTLLDAVKKHLDTTLIIIEHDIPLIRDVSDRVLAMDAGSVLAIGDADEVLESSAVADAFLGGSLEAINRSGAIAAPDLTKV